ncbi:MAG: nitrous oxide reductase accessory protein NosL [Campylobacterota bacterium]|nr:nitrous oxide reductase accessory protein NosL [Campylobacterota bacterium]
MIKIVVTIVSLFLVLGCNSNKTFAISHKQFQTVDKKDAVLVQSGSQKNYCIKCGMDLVKFYKTSHASESEGTKYQYCSLHCLEEHLGEGVTLKNPKVVDLLSLKLIPVGEAYYVVGSKKRGTMSRISKYAFKTIDDAKHFQDQYGGDIMDFSSARKKAQEDFKYYKR